MMTRPAVIAAASCAIGNRHHLVKSDTSTSMMKDQTEDGSRWSEPVCMGSDVANEKPRGGKARASAIGNSTLR